MNEYLESIRILLEIDEPNMELVYLIKSFPIKLIDGANSLFSNPEFELATKEENINYNLFEIYSSYIKQSGFPQAIKFLNANELVYD